MRHTLRYLASASRRDVDPTPWRSELFEEQRAFFDDRSRRKAALCSRRAGKTKVNGAGLIDAVVTQPADIALYITLTAGISYDMLWSELANANDRFGLGLTPSLSDNRFVAREGGSIWLAGCKDSREAEKFRGFRFSRIIIDEGGTYKPETLRYLIDSVLSAAATDHGAPIWLTGTPGPVPTGYFWAATTDGDKDTKAWNTHSWSVRNNPHHPFGREPSALEQYRIDELGLSLDHPTWIREYEGRWCLDTSTVIYLYSGEKNGWDGTLPAGHSRTILGIDLGYDDATAFVVTTSVGNVVYVQESFGRGKMLPADIAQAVRDLQGRYPIHEIYVDSGGLGKTIVAQLQQDFGLPVSAAEKQDKAGCIFRVQSALSAGRIKINPNKCHELLDEWTVLPWNAERTGHRERFADHCSDAFLYAFRRHPIREIVVPKPIIIDPGDQIRKQVMAQGLKKRNHRGW